MKTWFVFSVLSLFSFYGLSQATELKPALLPWHEQFNIEKIIFSADGHYLLTAGDDKTIIISDLKKRIQVAKITGTVSKAVVAHTSAPFFYTVTGHADSLLVQKRNFASGHIVQTTFLPGISSSAINRDRYLIDIDPINETFLLCYYDGFNNQNEKVVDANATIVEYSAEGKILQKITGIDDNEVNTVMKIKNEIWAATRQAVWKQNGTRFEKVLSPVSSKDFFSGIKCAGNTLILLSNFVQWYDLTTMKRMAKIDVSNFFAADINDNTARVLRFMHPFVVDEAGTVWLVNTKEQTTDNTKEKKNYSVARIDKEGITYPLQSDDKGIFGEFKEVEVEIAYNPAAAVFAVIDNSITGSVAIVDKKEGYQFNLGRKNIGLENFYFTSEPGKLLVRFSFNTKEAVSLRLSDGRLQTIDVIDDRSIAWQNRNATGGTKNFFVPLAANEKLFQPTRKAYKASYYWKKGDITELSLPADTCAFTIAPGLSVTVNDKEGSITWLGKTNYTIQLTDPEGKPVNEKWVYGHYGYDSVSSLLSLYWKSRWWSTQYVQIVHLPSKKIIKSWEARDMLLLPGGKEFINEGFGIYKLEDSSLVEAFPVSCRYTNNFICSRDGRYISFFKDNNFEPDEIIVWDRQLKKSTLLGIHPGIQQMEIDPHSGLIYTLGRDQTIKIWNPVTATRVAQIVFNATQVQYKQVTELRPGYLVLLPDGNYMGENKYYELLSMRNDEIEYPVFQMDAKFHRPDKVLTALGYADSTLIKAITLMTDRRVRRFSPATIKAEVMIREKNKLPYYTKQKDILFTVHLTGDSKDVAGLMLYINGTALWAYPGKPLTIFNSSSLFTTTIDLTDAGNHIRVCLVDKAGKETPGDYIYINANPGKKKDLYFVGIGMSEYKDDKNNLQYAAKDMQDIHQYFRTVSSYDNVYAYTATNKQVTMQVTDSIKKFLSKAVSQDQVIIYFAGHGMLETTSGNYYLSTYEWQSNKPATTGINIDDLNNAVAGSAARKKMMMIDACNSGLLDDKEMSYAYAPGDSAAIQNNKVVVRGLGGTGKAQNASAVRFAFNHFNQGNGVDILAASAGNEFAFETDSLKNGLFTYSLLTAFKSGDADLNKDNDLSISELQLYVSTMVSALSKGKQQPSFRQANLYQDIALLSAGDSYFSIFLQAARNNHLPTLKICLEKEKVNVNKKDERGFTALLYACREGSFHAVKYLLEKGADMHIKSEFNRSCLFLAAYNRNEKIVYYLFDKGAALKGQIETAWDMDTIRAHATPLILKMFEDFAFVKATEQKQYALTELLANEQIAAADSLYKQAKLDVNRWNLIEGVNALFVTVLQGRQKSLEWLLANGVNVNYTNNTIDGFTPLMAAAYSNNIQAVKLLLQHGADKNAQTSDGRTALKIANEKNHAEITVLLAP